MADRDPNPSDQASGSSIRPVIRGRWWWDGADWRFWDGTRWAVLGHELPSFVRVPRILWWSFLSAAIVCAIGSFLAVVVFVVQVGTQWSGDDEDLTGLATFVVAAVLLFLMLIFVVLAVVFRVLFVRLRPPKLVPRTVGIPRAASTRPTVQPVRHIESIAATTPEGAPNRDLAEDNAVNAATGSSVPANWYPSPQEPGLVRYWDGSNWTQHKEVAAFGLDPRTQDSRIMASLAHFSAFLLPVVIPLALRFTRGKTDAYVKHNASEAANFQLTYLVVWNAIFFAVISPVAMSGSEPPAWFIGLFLAMMGLGFACYGLAAYAAYVGYQGRWWRYPISVRLIPGSNKAAARAKQKLEYQSAAIEAPPPVTFAEDLDSHLRLGRKYGRLTVRMQALETILVPALMLLLSVLFGGFAQPPGVVPDFGYLEVLFLALSVLTGVTLIATMLWLYQASLAAQALGGRGRWSPVWAFVSFVVPIMSLFVPYQMASDCLPTGSRSRRTIAVWWGVRIASGAVVIAGIMASAFSTTAGVISAATTLAVLAGLLLATMRAVNTVNESQATGALKPTR